MAKSKHGGCCGGIILYAVVFLCRLLQLSTAFPYVTIEEFTVSALKETTNSSNTIHFDMKLRNLDAERSYYDALNLTFYYKSNFSSFPIGNATFSPFSQRKFGRDHRVGSIEARGVNWENVTAPVTFRVVLATAVRSEVKIYWKSKRLHLLVGADLKVNDQGILVNKGVELTSTGVKNNIKGSFGIIGILLVVFFSFILGKLV